jgi:hypothetical protein
MPPKIEQSYRENQEQIWPACSWRQDQIFAAESEDDRGKRAENGDENQEPRVGEPSRRHHAPGAGKRAVDSLVGGRGEQKDGENQ